MTSTSDREPSRLDSALRARPEDLVPGVIVSGVAGRRLVDVVAVRWHGANLITLTHRDSDGRTEQTALSRDREATLSLGKAGRTRPFDGDAEQWRLAAEALRIRVEPVVQDLSSTGSPQPLILEWLLGAHSS